MLKATLLLAFVPLMTCIIQLDPAGFAIVYDGFIHQYWDLSNLNGEYQVILDEHLSTMNAVKCTGKALAGLETEPGWPQDHLNSINQDLEEELEDTMLALTESVHALNSQGLNLSLYDDHNAAPCKTPAKTCPSNVSTLSSLSAFSDHDLGFISLVISCHSGNRRRVIRNILTGKPWGDKGASGILKSWFGVAYSDDVEYLTTVIKTHAGSLKSHDNKLNKLINVTTRLITLSEEVSDDSKLAVRRANMALKSIGNVASLLEHNKKQSRMIIFLNAYGGQVRAWGMKTLAQIQTYWSDLRFSWLLAGISLRSNSLPAFIFSPQEVQGVRSRLTKSIQPCHVSSVGSAGTKQHGLKISPTYLNHQLIGINVGFPVFCDFSTIRLFSVAIAPILTEGHDIYPNWQGTLVGFSDNTYYQVQEVYIPQILTGLPPYFVRRGWLSHVDDCFLSLLNQTYDACTITKRDKGPALVEHNFVTSRLSSYLTMYCDDFVESVLVPPGTTLLNTSSKCDVRITSKPGPNFRDIKLLTLPYIQLATSNNNDSTFVNTSNGASYKRLIDELKGLSGTSIHPVTLPEGQTWDDFIQSSAFYKNMDKWVSVVIGIIGGFSGTLSVCICLLFLSRRCMAYEEVIEGVTMSVDLTTLGLLFLILVLAIKIYKKLGKLTHERATNKDEHGKGLPVSMITTWAAIKDDTLCDTLSFVHTHIPGPIHNWEFTTAKHIYMDLFRHRNKVSGLINWGSAIWTIKPSICYLVESSVTLNPACFRRTKLGKPIIPVSMILLRVHLQDGLNVLCAYEAASVTQFSDDSLVIPCEERIDDPV